MLIRIIIKNLYSFYEETEFNMLPGRISRLGHHKYEFNDLNVLKMASLYGANGAGKSNLVKVFSLLKEIVTSERIPFDLNSKKFKLDEKAKDEPSYIGIEFFCEKIPYFYSVKINNNFIAEEELSISGLGKIDDKLLFRRTTPDEKNKQVMFYTTFENQETQKTLTNIIQKDLLKLNQSLFYLLNTMSDESFAKFKNIYAWFLLKLTVISPDMSNFGLPYLIDQNEEFKKYANDFLNIFNLGIDAIDSNKILIQDFYGKDKEYEINNILNEFEKNSSIVIFKLINDEHLVFHKQNKDIYVLKLILEHNSVNNKPVIFYENEESDGTKRLLDYLILYFDIIFYDKLYIVDEIERSIHPLLIKNLISKFSSNEKTNGQLIFTTHESNLLDQNIFRQDEIWFAEKNKKGSSELYPLSDFKEHHTIDIGKGYLNGRYGAIPFIGNLKDLNWDKYASDK